MTGALLFRDFKERIMSSSSSLTCNFTINSSLDIGVSFVSDDNGANYGGQITIFTPGTAGPVSTGLWDNDGNVFFTLYQSENPAINCVINSGSTPGSWDPYVEVAQQNGLICTITGPVQQPGENTFGYTLNVAQGTGVGQGAVTGQAAGSPTPQYVARMTLPAGGKEAWTLIMQGNTPVPDEISVGSPVVMAWARFDDGTQVAGGVYKSATPTDYNVKFMWVLDADGNQYPGWPIDVSDHEDFLNNGYLFSLTPDSEEVYLLNVVERPWVKS
ncbi:BppU_N domain-containing protein [Pseudomonas sp. IT-P44]|uniref:hypothetical protein n=1 Tax=Pseudomonas sp. IT-P44 TaxID=3026451 RepID=UPI0039DF8CE0